MRYTVILLYPEDLAELYGAEYYVDWTEAETPEAAATGSKAEAARNNDYYEPDNFLTVAVFEGCLAMAYSEMANG
jgi:hypothetical protein